MAQSAPVFVDESGRRWRRIRRVVLGVGIATTVLTALIVIGLLIPPLIPELPVATANNVPIARPLARETGVPLTKAGRRKRAAEVRLRAAIAALRTPPPPSRRASSVPVIDLGGAHARPRNESIVAGFYVNWDDNSFASLNLNFDKLDWVIGEWGFLDRSGDSLRIRVDGKVIDRLAAAPPDKRPSLFLMVSNYDSSRTDSSGDPFGQTPLRHMLRDSTARARVIATMRGTVLKYGLAGVTVDLENVPADLEPEAIRFTRQVKAALDPLHRLTTAAVPSWLTVSELQQWAAVTDKIFPMLFDQHYGGSDPGPIAANRWYADKARQIVAAVPPDKVIFMVGAYGYDWNDGERGVEARTFQEVMAGARLHNAHPMFDPESFNSYVTFTDPDSTDHVVWYLDGVTAFNEFRMAQRLGAAGAAIWRLGSEDPSIWRALNDDGHLLSADSLKHMPAGYDPEIIGQGEILQITAFPTDGARSIHVDPLSGYITGQAMQRLPLPYVVSRYGAGRHPHWVALTFDDGPDGRWTPQILDTLRSRGAHATFFMIGENIDSHIPLVKRVYAEGNEIGNHSFTHPNMALTPNAVSKLQIDATERAIEAVLGRRSALFRPPYFGDAEPTTADELVPVGIASRRNYYTVGLHIDSEDWKEPPPDTIIANVLRDRRRGNVILLHDAGGDRSNTVAALGRLIDTLRAGGDTLVLASELAGIPRDEAMPPLTALSSMQRWVQLGGFAAFGGMEWLLFWVFTIAVYLGIGRLVIIGVLALVQRLRQHQRRELPTSFAPAVSVIIPAYNEAKVVPQTITSLLAQDYPGELEIVVVDDGSRDNTYEAAMAAHGHNPRVSIYRKVNGGKASALNFGLAHAKHDILIGLDADTVFSADTVRELVQPLADPKVGAVAGNAKVGNRINLVTRWQALEYVTSQNLDRRAFSLLDCITVVPGAVGAWRREVVQQVGGFRDDTLAEDQDLTLGVRRAGYSVAYADGAVAYTEAPDSLRGLARQRFRWSFGTLQCAWKHRDALFRRKYGTLGWVALPNVWLFQLVLPAISPVADLMFLWSLLSVWLTWRDHGATYSLTNLEVTLSYYAVFLIVDWAAAMIGFLMEPGEDRQLTWLIFLQRFAYRQVMYWVVVRSFVAAVRGRVVGWGSLERKATVELAPALRRAHGD